VFVGSRTKGGVYHYKINFRGEVEGEAKRGGKGISKEGGDLQICTPVDRRSVDRKSLAWW